MTRLMREERHEFDGSGPDVDADGNEARTEDDPGGAAVRLTAPELTLVMERLVSLLGPDMPTPQGGRVDDGMLQTCWLVNGTCVTAWADDEGDVTIDAFGADGTVLWDYDLGVNFDSDDPGIRTARELLSVMAREVKYPVPSQMANS